MKDILTQLVTKVLDLYLTEEVMAQSKQAVVDFLRAQAAKTETALDDYAVDKIEEWLKQDF